jgi:hypothetical protein
LVQHPRLLDPGAARYRSGSRGLAADRTTRGIERLALDDPVRTLSD